MRSFARRLRRILLILTRLRNMLLYRRIPHLLSKLTILWLWVERFIFCYFRAVELGNGKSHFIKGHSDFVLTVDTYGPFVVSAGKDKTIKLWKKQDDSFEFKLLATFIGHIEAISSVCFGGKTGRVFASGSEDQNLKIWEIANLQARAHKITNPENVTSSKRTVAAHTKDINVVRFSPNEKLLASAS